MSPNNLPSFSKSTFTGLDEHEDAVKFAHALRPPPKGLYTLENFCPSITPHSSCLDVILYRGVLLVAYAAANEVIIAKATDLQAIRRLTLNKNDNHTNVTALAFRQHDAAIAASFGTTIVIFEGWSNAAKERTSVYQSKYVESKLNIQEHNSTSNVVSLSWDREGSHLCAVADSILIWTLDYGYLPVKYTLTYQIPKSNIPTFPLSLGAISPDASLVVVCGLYARIAYVWDLNRKVNTSRSVAEIIHGRSGIAALDWKRRGGGNQALMTTDRDGTIRLWVRSYSNRTHHNLSSQNQNNSQESEHHASPNTKSNSNAKTDENPIATGIDSWMEEIARSPHVERTPRAGASFLSWGGGGGVADDEGDAKATHAAIPMLTGTAPKPSRCHHWIVHVAGGDARAWRVRGLDDRPRAEFTKLEPGSGEPLLGVEDEFEDELPKSLPLKDISVSALKAVSPIPLTTSSNYKVGLVKSYAISNGERRLRSPEPPEPPNVIALFILAIKNGLPFLARYDFCPTSTIPAICRARIGLGHMSNVIQLTHSPSSNSSSPVDTGGWLASRGRSGDVLLWKTNVSTGAWGPMRMVAILPGPHTAIGFSPTYCASPNRSEVGVFSSDAATGSLRLFTFVNFVSLYDHSAGQDIQIARQVTVCQNSERIGIDDAVKQLVIVPFDGNEDLVSRSKATVGILGVRQTGLLSSWIMTRRQKDVVDIGKMSMKFKGKRHQVVKCIAGTELTSIGKQIVVFGGSNGSLIMYIVGLSEEYVRENGVDEDEDFARSSEDDSGNKPESIWLNEMCCLENPDYHGDAVVNIEMMTGASRILAIHASGATVIWARDTTEKTKWEVELVIPGCVKSQDLKSKLQASTDALSVDERRRLISTTSSIGYDRDGNLSVMVLRGDGLFERYRRVLGQPWEHINKREAPQDTLTGGTHSIVHIAKGVIATTNGRGLSVLASTRSDTQTSSYTSDAAGYSPSKALVAQLLTGGRAWQVSAALNELHSFIRKVTKKTILETSYSTGRGTIAPPPSLKVLLSERDTAENEEDKDEDTSDLGGIASNTFQLGGGKNLFMQLMAKSNVNQDATGANEEDGLYGSGGEGTGLSNLASRLRVVSLAGLTRNEQTVLAAIAKACASLKKTFGSLDVSGGRYALLASSHRELTKTEPVPLSIVASAVHSSSRDALMDHFLPSPSPGGVKVNKNSDGLSKMWETAKALGAGWWISTNTECKKLAERIARADFGLKRNADDAALWYIALGRRTTLAALYRAQQNARMSQFLLRNFDQKENRVAAGKNAYVLVSKHRLELAVTFFLLSGDISGALSLIRSRIKDYQLALFLARVIGDEEQIKKTLEFIIEKSTEEGDDHQKSIALWLNGQHEAALLAAGNPRNNVIFDKMGENVKALVGCLPDVVHSLGHVLAIADRPPVRGTELAKKTVSECRRKAVQALLGDGSPVAALVIAFEIIRSEAGADGEIKERAYSKRNVETTLGLALLAAVDVLQGRAVCLSGAVRSGAVEENLQDLILQDIKDLESSPLGLERTITAVEYATFELVKEDEIDSAMAVSYAALDILGDQDIAQFNQQLIHKIQAAQRNCLRIAVSKALLNVQGTLSLLHHPCLSSHRLSSLLAKYKLATTLIDRSTTSRGNLYHRLTLEFKGSVLSLRFAYMFLKGDWPGILQALRSCDSLWQPRERSVEEIVVDPEKDDSQSFTSCSSMAPDAVSIEALRHVASNPAILRISRSLGHVRRYRKTPSMSMAGVSNGSTAVVVDDNLGTPTLAVSADDPYAVIRMHPALSSTLASAAAAYLSTHLASKAASFARFVSKDSKKKHRNSELYWQNDLSELSSSHQSPPQQGYDQSFRLIKSAESLEHLVEDVISQWIPLQRFGIEASDESMSHPDEAAGAFVDLWSTLGCLPEYAPCLSEAATVAAAEMAAAASRAAIEAAEQKDGGRRRRRRKERQGEYVANAEKEGLKLFDTTSANSLHGAYPVRFSSSAQGPWSGRGKNATLYSEDRSLFRTLCVSSTDPPAVVVATPKGIQEIVPSSYTTMPAGFRSHYASNQRKKVTSDGTTDERLAALASDKSQDDNIDRDGYDDDGTFMNSYDGFGEGPYVPLDLSKSHRDTANVSHSRLTDVANRKAVWRHQVNAMTLASHPFRRRFASGGADGIVRLWDFADPISLASFKEDNFGRISDIRFSAYGNTMLAVYSSGHVVIWDDPDVYSSHPKSFSKNDLNSGRGKSSRAKIIRAFDNRAASAATFLDERHIIAVVGDPTAPPSVGNSLRIFDTREANSSFHASWSAAVNHQFEARCISLLEDRLRVVTGGLDGSLSIVDLRTKACIAELRGHSDEVTCLALESPRGRALVSGSANGEIRLWDSRTLLCLDTLLEAHTPTRHYWSGNGFSGLVGSYGTQGLALTDRSLISCGGDGMVKLWGPGWSDFDLKVL